MALRAAALSAPQRTSAGLAVRTCGVVFHTGFWLGCCLTLCALCVRTCAQVAMAGFGAGLTWASAIVRWG